MIEENKIPRAITIAGSDSGGGAGIQADLKVFTALEVYGMSAVTAITAQNTRGVEKVQVLPAELVRTQIEVCAKDIGVDALKTGMLANSTLVKTVARACSDLGLKNLVVDPVMVAKSGAYLLEEVAWKTLKEELFPLAKIVTPNLFEAEEITGMKIKKKKDMEKAAREILGMGPEFVVIKGGHFFGDPTDLVYEGNEFFWFEGKRIETSNTHGTGCSFSAAIASGLAKGLQPLKAIEKAKRVITWGIKHSFDLGSGYGPTNHFYFQKKLNPL